MGGAEAQPCPTTASHTGATEANPHDHAPEHELLHERRHDDGDDEEGDQHATVTGVAVDAVGVRLDRQVERAYDDRRGDAAHPRRDPDDRPPAEIDPARGRRRRRPGCPCPTGGTPTSSTPPSVRSRDGGQQRRRRSASRSARAPRGRGGRRPAQPRDRQAQPRRHDGQRAERLRGATAGRAVCSVQAWPSTSGRCRAPTGRVPARRPGAGGAGATTAGGATRLRTLPAVVESGSGGIVAGETRAASDASRLAGVAVDQRVRVAADRRRGET